MIYVTSDIHGNRRRFDSILSQVNLQNEDTLYILGDVIDRHPDGIKILRQIMKMPNVKMLLGNHEFMLLNALYFEQTDYGPAWHNDRRLQLWYRNGGEVTHNYLKRIRKSLRQEIFRYLDSLPLSFEINVDGKRFVLVHAAPPELYQVLGSSGRYKSEREFAVWYRFNHGEECPVDGTLIFGHTTTGHYQYENPLSIWHGQGMIGIDCGSGYPDSPDPWTGIKGRLGCLRLNDMCEFYSEEFEEPEDIDDC